MKSPVRNVWVSWKKTFSFLMLFAATLSVQAASTVAVENGHVRETIPGTKVSSAYMEITNSGTKDVALIKVTSTISQRVEIHEHAHVNGMMKMQQIKSLPLPAGKVTKLQPGGFHIMIFDLDQPLKSGETALFTFHFSDDSSLKVKLPIESLVRKKKKAEHHHHH